MENSINILRSLKKERKSYQINLVMQCNKKIYQKP